MLEEEERAVVHPRQPGPEPPLEAPSLVLVFDFGLLALPVDPERRVREEVVELFACELIVDEAVSEPHVVARAVVVDLFHEHVGGGGGVGALVVVLAVDVELRGRVVLTEVVLGLGEHASRAASGVEQRAHGARRGEEVVVFHEEDVHHEPDDLAGGEVVASGFVGELVETADEVFEDEAHLGVGNGAGVEVDVAELGDDHVEDARLVHLRDLGFELEVVEDLLDVGGEAPDVGGQVLGDGVRVGLEPLEVEFGAVVEALPRDSVQLRFEGLAAHALGFEAFGFGEDLSFRFRQHTIESPQDGHGEHDPLVLGRPVGTAEKVRDLPDEVREVGMVGHSARRVPRRPERGPSLARLVAVVGLSYPSGRFLPTRMRRFGNILSDRR